MRVLLLWPLGLLASVLPAQTAGVTPEWETRKLLQSLNETAKKLQPLVSEMRPASWRDQGAPEAYHQQWERVQTAIETLDSLTQRLSKQPTKLNLAIETMYGMERLQLYLQSLAGGVRRYHNPAVADLMVHVADQNDNNRDALKQYILDLAISKEEELRVMDNEAQRCVGMLVKQAPPARSTRPVSPSRPAVQPAKPKERP
jgi:ABC-type transporter Mla subunit MlaD